MATKVKVDITADGTGFHRVMGGINSSVKGFASSMKTQLAAAFSVATIGLITKSILDFGDKIQTMAKNLDISTDSAQRFDWAMRNANVGANTLTKGLNAVDTAMKKALAGDENSKNILSQLGLSKDDLSHLPKDKALLQILSYTKNQSRSKTESLLSAIGLPTKVSGSLLGAREDFLNGNIPLVPKDQIASLDAMGDALSNIVTIIKISLIPSLLAFVKTLLESSSIVLKEYERFKSAGKASKESGGNDPGLMKEFYEKVKVRFKQGINVLEYVTKFSRPGTDAFRKDAYEFEMTNNKIAMQYWENLFGKGTPAALRSALGYKNPKKVEDTSVVGRITKEINLLLATINNPTKRNVELPFEREAAILKQQKAKNFNPTDALGTSNFLKIGNILGIDAQYRLERLTIQTNSYLARIADGIDDLNRSDSSEDEFSR